LNVLIQKPASAGMEDAPAVILQGHMDMVCEKEPDVSFDFLNDGLRLQVNGDEICADGTTLGGDDGIAVAFALAILDDDTLAHPALEALFTTQEETGMEGAFAFDCSKLRGRYIVNIDSEEEGTVLTSCAGGETITVHYPLQYEPVQGVCYQIHIHGLLGGHSGADIHFGRANAIVLMGQLLYIFYSTGVEFQLASIEGGGKNNAIARECTAYVYLNPDELEALKIVMQDFVTRVAQEFGEREPSIYVDFAPADQSFDKAYCACVTDALVDSIAHVSDGVCQMSEEIADMVETSSNLGVLRQVDDVLELEFLARSSEERELDTLVDVIQYAVLKGTVDCMKECDAEALDSYKPQVIRSNRYPGWSYRADSSLRRLVCDVYEKQYGKPMKVTAIHAGLECGIFASRGDFDMISIGPDILDIHTPKETLKIASTARTYQLVCEVLRRAGELE
jgi:dipeptidase D